MNEEEIRKIAKETFDKNIMNNLDSSIVFKYVQTLEKENKKYKEVINKAINYINNNIIGIDIKSDNIMLNRTELLDILKEVEHD